MEYEFLINSLRKRIQLTPQEEKELCSLLSIRQLKKKDFLLREGEVCLYECFINKGCLRTFYTDQTGMEHTFYLGVEGWWISDMDSRISGTPASCNIVALEDTEVVQISQIDLEKILRRVPALEHFFRVMYENSIASHQARFVQLLHLNGEERYRRFRAKYPEFDKRVPQKYIATLLGLTPEFFSTVRSKVLRAGK